MGRPSKSYEVGYGKPPASSRFKPGQSGNKNGRPKKRQTMIEQFDLELNRRLVIRENGEKRTLTMMQIIVKQIVAKAAKGEQKSLKFLSDVIQQLDAVQQRNEESDSAMSLTMEDIEKMTDAERTDAYRRLIDLGRTG